MKFRKGSEPLSVLVPIDSSGGPADQGSTSKNLEFRGNSGNSSLSAEAEASMLLQSSTPADIPAGGTNKTADVDNSR